MTHDEFVKLLEERGEIVYIVDRSLIRFGKFVLAILAIFALVGVFFFSIDIKKASDQVKEARYEMQKTSSEINEAHEQLTKLQGELKKSQDDFASFLTGAEQEAKNHLQEITESSKRTLGIEQEATTYILRIKQFGQGDKGLTAIALTTKDSFSRDYYKDANQPSRIKKVHIGVVSEVSKLRTEDLTRLANALQKQVSRDLYPVWDVDATVEVFSSLDNVPKDYWPIIIKADIGTPGASGMHLDNDGSPFSLVQYDSNFDNVTLTASHELLGMIVDPFGNRLVSVPSPDPADHGKLVHTLVEISQPSEAAEYGYRIDDVLVSDFVTPGFFNLTKGKGDKYSVTDSIKEPLKIQKGGFISWENSETGEWHQEIWFGNEPEFRSLGRFASSSP